MPSKERLLPVGIKRENGKNGSRTKTKPGCYYSNAPFTQKGASSGGRPYVWSRHLWNQVYTYCQNRKLPLPGA